MFKNVNELFTHNNKMKFHPGDTHSSSWNLSRHVALIPSWLQEMSVFCWVLTHTGRAAAGPAALQSEQQGAADPHKHSETEEFMKLWITADDAFKRATEASSRQNIDFKIHVRILKRDHLFYKSYFYITAYKHVDWAETNIIWSVCVFICFFVFWLYCEGNQEDFYFHTSCYFLSKWNWRHQISHSSTGSSDPRDVTPYQYE